MLSPRMALRTPSHALSFLDPMTKYPRKTPTITDPSEAIRLVAAAVQGLAHSPWVSRHAAAAMVEAINAIDPVIIEAEARRWEVSLVVSTTMLAKVAVKDLLGTEWVKLEAAAAAEEALNKFLPVRVLGLKAPDKKPRISIGLDTNAEVQELGVAEVTDIGEENVYVNKDGASYYFKPGNTEQFALGSFDFGSVNAFDETPALAQGTSRMKSGL